MCTCVVTNCMQITISIWHQYNHIHTKKKKKTTNYQKCLRRHISQLVLRLNWSDSPAHVPTLMECTFLKKVPHLLMKGLKEQTPTSTHIIVSTANQTNASKYTSHCHPHVKKFNLEYHFEPNESCTMVKLALPPKRWFCINQIIS